jgi:hypothetical protein
MRPNYRNQEDRILCLLEAARPSWTPAPSLAQISLQYGRAVNSLRRKGWLIENRVRIVDGVRHGEFRLGSHLVAAQTPPIPAASTKTTLTSPPGESSGSPSTNTAEYNTDRLFPDDGLLRQVHRDDG